MRTISLRRVLVLGASFALLMTQFGCAFGEFRPDDPFKRQYSLERAQQRYSDLVRWSKFGEAAQFVAVDQRASFQNGMPDFREVRFTEHETGCVAWLSSSDAGAPYRVKRHRPGIHPTSRTSIESRSQTGRTRMRSFAPSPAAGATTR